MQAQMPDIEIRDIHVPEVSLWWPMAPGWWMLALLPLLVMFGFWLYSRRHQYRSVQKAASRELDRVYESYRRHHDSKRFVRDLSVLLRRISISRYGRHAANLTGESWLVFLDRGLLAGVNRSGFKFSGTVGQCLLSVPYRKDIRVEVEVDKLHRLSLEWVSSLSRRNQLDLETRQTHENKKPRALVLDQGKKSVSV